MLLIVLLVALAVLGSWAWWALRRPTAARPRDLRRAGEPAPQSGDSPAQAGKAAADSSIWMVGGLQ